MLLIVDSVDLEVIRKYNLITLDDLTYHPVCNSLCVTGTQVRDIIKEIFDYVWCDSTPYGDKYWLSNLGWRLANNCL